MSLPVRIGADIRLPLAAVPRLLLEALQRRTTFANPDRAAAERGGRFTWNLPATVSLMSTERGEVVLPRGAMRLLMDEAAKAGIPLAVQSSVVWDGSPHLAADYPPRKGRPYQIEAEDALLKRVQGYVRLPCGGGKTSLGCRAIVRSGQSALILVHSEDLLQQWDDTLRLTTTGRIRLVSGGGGARFSPLAPRECAVATVQMLVEAGPDALPLIRSPGVILADEAHHIGALSLRTIVSICPARYRWGLTATPERPDGWGFLLPLLIGPEVYAKRAADLVALGYLVLPRIVPVHTGFSVPGYCTRADGRLDFTKASDALHGDLNRQALVRDLCATGARSGRSVLALLGRVDAAERLAEELRAMGVRAEAVTGDVGKRKRREMLDRTRAGLTSVLVATQLADEGLDVPRLDMLVLAAGGRAAGRAVQRVGRLMRPSGAPPVAFDLIDGGLEGQWHARSSAYQKEIEVGPERPVAGATAVGMVRGLAAA